MRMANATKKLIVYRHYPDLATLRWLAGYVYHIHPLYLRRTESSPDLEVEPEPEPDVISEEMEMLFLRSLDPKEWKKQDHYAVLGLKKMRYRATDVDIKKAYRRKVLQHHPDKRRGRGEVIMDDSTDYFTCITRAYEVLGNQTRRQSYDSVDSDFDETVPPVNDISKANFFDIFGPAFSRNARWSRKQPVPLLGADYDDYRSVEKFYSFWYNFDSWREFSYLDEEDKEKGENREERRWIDKQNKESRQKRRKDEVKRILTLVDNAKECDPRIKRFDTEEKERRESVKKEKAETVRRRQEEEDARRKAAEEEDKLRREAEEKQKKEEAERAKKENNAQKKVAKTARKNFRTLCKDKDYFLSSDSSAADRVSQMGHSETLAERLSPAELQSLTERLQSGGVEVFDAAVKQLEQQRAQEQAKLVDTSSKTAAASTGDTDDSFWTYDMVATLVKAVKQFPAGTNKRWDAVADFVNTHGGGSREVTHKEALKKAKGLAQNEDKLKTEANQQAFARLSESVKPSVDTNGSATSDISQRDPSAVPTAWTPDEQKLLETALRKFPASVGANRWDLISDAVGTRSKRDCMLRYKELVRLVQASKKA